MTFNNTFFETVTCPHCQHEWRTDFTEFTENNEPVCRSCGETFEFEEEE